MLEYIKMKDLHDRMKNLGKNEIILDVRRPDEYAEGHIAGSINFSHDVIENHISELKKYEKIYIHCRSGKRAQVALAALEKHGFKNIVCIADGGMLDWVAAGYEVVK